MNSFNFAPIRKEGKPYHFDREDDGKEFPAPISPEESRTKRKSLSLLLKEAKKPTNLISPEGFCNKVKFILAEIEANDGYQPDTHEAGEDMMEELLIALGYGAAMQIIRSYDRWYS